MKGIPLRNFHQKIGDDPPEDSAFRGIAIYSAFRCKNEDFRVWTESMLDFVLKNGRFVNIHICRHIFSELIGIIEKETKLSGADTPESFWPKRNYRT